MKKLLFSALSLLLMASCSREGPSGPPGPRGPQGPQGPAGLGTQFNIIDVTVAPVDWQEFGQPGDSDYQYFFEINAPEIDALAFDQSLVLGYLIDNGTSYILPNTVNFGNFTREYSMYYGIGYIGFIVKDSDLQTTPPSNDLQYKVYVIDPQAKKSGMESWTPTEWELYLSDKEVRHLQADARQMQ